MAELTDSLISHWKLNEASGTRNDSHGTNHLTDNNTVTQAAGKIGNAAQFTEANSEYLNRASNATLQTGDINFTLAGWVYLDTDILDMVLAEKGSGGAEYLLYYSSGTGRFLFSAGGDLVTADSFGAPSTAAWIFIVAWLDTDADKLKIQINNGTVDEVDVFAPPSTDAGAFILGSFDGANLFLDGRLDSVSFWKRLLTAAERTRLYNSGNGLDYSDFGTPVTAWNSPTEALCLEPEVVGSY